MTPQHHAGAPSSRAGHRVSVRAHAKINLSLHVVGCREDGYHLLKTVFQTLALHDTLIFERRDGAFSLSCVAPGVPTDESNLVWRAANLSWQASGRAGTPEGIGARIVKRIPAQGGLGGGSSDAAAALVALDALWDLQLGPERLFACARRLGADVPVFLCGGTVLGLDRGDELYPLEDLPRRTVLLVFPPFGVSTAEAFRWFDEDAKLELRATPASGLSGEPTPELRATPVSPGVRLAGSVDLPVVNDLEGPVSRRHPEIAAVRALLLREGAETAAMTGSGSTVFGLFEGPERAGRAAAALQEAGWRTLVTATATRRQARGNLRRAWTRSSPIV